MKIAILGAGALGCIYGTYFAKNNDVTMVVRRKEAADFINKYGITMVKDDEEVNEKVSAVLSGESIDVQDLIIVLVKGYDTQKALLGVLPAIDDNTLVLSLQNGMGNYENIVPYVDKPNIIMGTSGTGGHTISEAKVKLAGASYDYIGSKEGAIDKVKIIEKLFLEAGLDNVIIEENIDKAIWSKLFINVGINALTALFEKKNSILIDNEYGNKLSRLLICEAVEVANKQGMGFGTEEVIENFEKSLIAENKSSMFQDILLKRKTEIDTINGAIVKKGKELGVKTPYNEFISELIRAKEKELVNQ